MLRLSVAMGCAWWLAGVNASAQPATWTQLSLGTCGVDRFLADHPDSDGRGVVIAILDTGVDPSIPGLTRTSTGEVKVVDVQDFSGEGDTDLHQVRRADDANQVINHDDDGAAIRYDLPDLPGEGRQFWFGWLEEKKFVNAPVPDLNDNGSTDDRFPLLVTANAGDGDSEAMFFIDANLDRSFADETGLRNYPINYDTFTLRRRQPEDQIVPLTFAVNIFLRERKVVLHYDDGAHGTHVAGIAAGYRINNQDNFHGVAPGAKVISLKIGNNAVGGISTTESKKKAMEYAARYAREHGVPVVCNLSYGVASTIEGDSAIDKFYDEHLRKNPLLVFCTSAGNIGPGLSTVGTPAAAASAITVGALLAADSARDVMGYALQQPVPTVFTSRGGELAKPDVITPGWSTSTVPRWVTRGDYWSGTSMASPYCAGMCALMISDVLRQYASTTIQAWDVKRALWRSAAPIDGFTALDTGWGIPDLIRAAKELNNLAGSAGDDPLQGYAITTSSPHALDGSAESAYWRGTFFPDQEQQVFTVAPVFAPGINGSARTGFTRRFALRSMTPWCRVDQESFYLRGEQTGRVFVNYDANALQQPGLYVGQIEATWNGKPEFRLQNTIVVPHRFGSANGHRQNIRNATAHGWQPDRYFLAVPPGASAMRLTLRAPSGAESKASIQRIFDPHGHQHRQRSNRLDTSAGRREVVWSVVDDLSPGIWEADIVADRPDKSWPYELDVRFFGVDAAPPRITSAESAARKPAGKLTLTNQFEAPLPVTLGGAIEGFRATHEEKFTGLKDVIKKSVTLGPNCSHLRLILEMEPEDYAETTDIAVAVLDESGHAVYDGAFNHHHMSASVRHPAPGKSATLTLRITGGFAIADDQRETPITIRTDHLLSAPVDLKVERGESNTVRLVPSVPVKISYAAAQDLPAAPDGTHAVGYISIQERNTQEEARRVVIDLQD